MSIQGLNAGMLGKIEIHGEKFTAQIQNSITAASLERTIEGSSSLEITVRDPERYLQKAQFFSHKADLLMDDLWFRVTNVVKNVDDFTITFEDREVAMLRQCIKPRRESRAHTTRAQFLQRLIKEVPHIQFVSPELNVKQPVETQAHSETYSRSGTLKKDTKTKKISAFSGVQINAKGLDADQITNVNTVLAVAEQEKASDPVTLAMLEAALSETGFNTSKYVTSSVQFSDPQAEFAGELANQTGLNEDVVLAWVLAETGYKENNAPFGPNNWLNIGITGEGNHGVTDSIWDNPKTAGKATAEWLKGHNSVPGYGTSSSQIQEIAATAGQPAANQISKIQYHGPGGWSTAGEPALPGIYEKLVAGTTTSDTGNTSALFGTITLKGTGLSIGDVAGAARHWLNTGFYGKGGGIANGKKGLTPGQIAFNVMGKNNAAHFETYKEKAKEIFEASANASTNSQLSTSSAFANKTHSFIFSRGEPGGPFEEDTWECGTRLAKEVNWRWFCVSGVIYFISDWDLIRTAPRMNFGEKTKGIINIDYEIDHVEKKNPPKATVEARAGLWNAPPGTVVILAKEMGEEIAGPWIVGAVHRKELTEDAVEIDLIRPMEPKIEAFSNESQTISAQAGQAVTTQDGGVNAGKSQVNNGTGQLLTTAIVFKAYRQAKWISEQKYPYIYGGGHGASFGPSSPGPPFAKGLDCSGAVSWVLHEAGILLAPKGSLLGAKKTAGLTGGVPSVGSGGAVGPQTTQYFSTWGESGKGQYMTIWVRNAGGQEHVYIEFNIPERGVNEVEHSLQYLKEHPDVGKHINVIFEASHPNTIVGFVPEYTNLLFEPRHWPGT